MFKFMAIAIVTALPFVFCGQAMAQAPVTCPAGTCSKNGTDRAKDAKNCKASNCKAGTPLTRAGGIRR
jgi:hypothetical protein